jgi:hypothetical protein
MEARRERLCPGGTRRDDNRRHESSTPDGARGAFPLAAPEERNAPRHRRNRSCRRRESGAGSGTPPGLDLRRGKVRPGGPVVVVHFSNLVTEV